MVAPFSGKEIQRIFSHTNYVYSKIGKLIKMEAINTTGSGVTKFDDNEEFEEKIHSIFVNVHKPGIRAIVVNNADEAKQIMSQYAVYQDKIHDMTGEHFDFHRTRWNLLTVKQAKGLEFVTVS